MITTSTLNPPTPAVRALGVGRIAVAVLLVIALTAVAFVVGRTTANSHSTTSTTSITLPASSTAGCRPHVPC